MGVLEIIIIGVGLAMDAFAVSVCKGLSLSKLRLGHILTVALWFGGFQALMPLVGYFLGTAFSSYVQQFDHYIAFILLTIIGVNMIREALSEDENDCVSCSLGFFVMLPLAVATSIDALAVGVTLAFYKVDVILAVFLIGLVTFVISAAGVKIGNIFGVKYRKKAEIAGGSILILLGIKLLIEGLI